mgnify:CR=1 FL=1
MPDISKCINVEIEIRLLSLNGLYRLQQKRRSDDYENYKKSLVDMYGVCLIVTWKCGSEEKKQWTKTKIHDECRRNIKIACLFHKKESKMEYPVRKLLRSVKKQKKI